MNLTGYKTREFVTITQLATFSRCPRKDFYANGVGLRRIPVDGESGSQALFFGTCIHKAIGAYFSSGYSFAKAIEAFRLAWGDTIGDERRNSETARMMMASFASEHPKGGGLYEPLPPPSTAIKVADEDKISDWEVPFAIDVGIVHPETKKSIPLLGRIDGLCRSRMTGEVMENEYKTSYEVSDRIFSGFKRNPQIVGYTLAGRTGGYPSIRGSYVEILRSSNRQWETQIRPFDVADFELERFVNWARVMGQAVLDCEVKGNWPQWLTGCHPYSMFGIPGYICEYDPLCSVEDWSTMKNFYNVDYHVPFVLPTINGEEIKPKGDSDVPG